MEIDRLQKVPDSETQHHRARLEEAENRISVLIRERDQAIVNAQRLLIVTRVSHTE